MRLSDLERVGGGAKRISDLEYISYQNKKPKPQSFDIQPKSQTTPSQHLGPGELINNLFDTSIRNPIDKKVKQIDDIAGKFNRVVEGYKKALPNIPKELYGRVRTGASTGLISSAQFLDDQVWTRLIPGHNVGSEEWTKAKEKRDRWKENIAGNFSTEAAEEIYKLPGMGFVGNVFEQGGALIPTMMMASAMGVGKVALVGKGARGVSIPAKVGEIARRTPGTSLFYSRASQGYIENYKEEGYTHEEASRAGLIDGISEVFFGMLGVNPMNPKTYLRNVWNSAALNAAQEIGISLTHNLGIRTLVLGEELKDTPTIFQEAVISGAYGAALGALMTSGTQFTHTITNVITPELLQKAQSSPEKMTAKEVQTIIEEGMKVLSKETGVENPLQTMKENLAKDIVPSMTEIQKTLEQTKKDTTVNEIAKLEQDLQKYKKQGDLESQLKIEDKLNVLKQQPKEYKHVLSETQKNIQSMFKSNLGVDIEYVSPQVLPEGKQAMFNIDKEGNKIISVSNQIKNSAPVIAHEVIHMLENTKSYDVLKQYIYKMFPKEVKVLETQLKKIYKGDNTKLIESEVVGNFIESYFDVDKITLKELSNLLNSDKGTFNVLQRGISKLANKINNKSSFSKDLWTVKRLYEKAVNEYSKNVKPLEAKIDKKADAIIKAKEKSKIDKKPVPVKDVPVKKITQPKKEVTQAKPKVVKPKVEVVKTPTESRFKDVKAITSFELSAQGKALEAKTKPVEAKPKVEAKPLPTTDFKLGDTIYSDSFGKGKVIRVTDTSYEIKFDDGNRNILKTHRSLSKTPTESRFKDVKAITSFELTAQAKAKGKEIESYFKQRQEIEKNLMLSDAELAKIQKKDGQRNTHLPKYSDINVDVKKLIQSKQTLYSTQFNRLGIGTNKGIKLKVTDLKPKSINAVLAYKNKVPQRVKDAFFNDTPSGKKLKNIHDYLFGKLLDNNAKAYKQTTELMNKYKSKFNLERTSKLDIVGNKRKMQIRKVAEYWGEGKYPVLTKRGNWVEHKYTQKELNKDLPNIADQKIAKELATEIRTDYDKAINWLNDVFREMGLPPIKKRADYMQHFYEFPTIIETISTWKQTGNKQYIKEYGEGKLKSLAKWATGDNDWLITQGTGVLTKMVDNLDVTQFKNALPRHGVRRRADALKGVIDYQSRLYRYIYETEALHELGVYKDALINEYNRMADDLETKRKDPLENSNLQNLKEYTNWINDTIIQYKGKSTGKGGDTMDAYAEGSFKIAYNIMGRAATQLISINPTQWLINRNSARGAMMQFPIDSQINGALSTLMNVFKKDGLSEQSRFMTNRKPPKFEQKTIDALQELTFIFTSNSDSQNNNMVLRTSYYHYLNHGDSHDIALAKADKTLERTMPDRTKYGRSTLMNDRALKIPFQFTMERFNDFFGNMVHDTIYTDFASRDNYRQVFKVGNKTIVDKQITDTAKYNIQAKILTGAKQAITLHLFANLLFSIGGRVLEGDILGLFKKIKEVSEDEEISLRKKRTVILDELIKFLPTTSFVYDFVNNKSTPTKAYSIDIVRDLIDTGGGGVLTGDYENFTPSERKKALDAYRRLGVIANPLMGGAAINRIVNTYQAYDTFDNSKEINKIIKDIKVAREKEDEAEIKKLNRLLLHARGKHKPIPGRYDAAGGLMFPLGTNKAQQIKNYTFGIYADPNADKYYTQEFPTSMGHNQLRDYLLVKDEMDFMTFRKEYGKTPLQKQYYDIFIKNSPGISYGTYHKLVGELTQTKGDTNYLGNNIPYSKTKKQIQIIEQYVKQGLSSKTAFELRKYITK